MGMNQQPQRIYEFGSFRLDAAEHLLLRDGEQWPQMGTLTIR